MALIVCPECGKQVSDQAASCPSCGHPLRGRPGGKATLIEQTAKPWKKVQAAGVVIMLLAPLSMLVIAYTSSADVFLAVVPLLVLGVVVHLVGRFGAWWHHG